MRVVLAEDSVLLRQGLVALLSEKGFATEDRKMAELLSYRAQQGRPRSALEQRDVARPPQTA